MGYSQKGHKEADTTEHAHRLTQTQTHAHTHIVKSYLTTILENIDEII